MTPTRRIHRPAPLRAAFRAFVAALLLAGVACGRGSAPPPVPGQSLGVPPDLRGRRVVLLPVQLNEGVQGDLDAEMRYVFTDRGREVDWILEEDVQEALRRAPSMDAQTRGLPVYPFTQGVVERVGDPLYGQLRRISALVEAEAILLPVQASYQPNETIVDSEPRVRLTATLIEPRTGRVLWYGVEEGLDLPQSDPRALLSAVERMAGTLFWYARR